MFDKLLVTSKCVVKVSLLREDLWEAACSIVASSFKMCIFTEGIQNIAMK